MTMNSEITVVITVLDLGVLQVFSSVLLALIRCFFFSNLRWIILFSVFFRFSTVFSLNIGGRYVVWMNNMFFFFYRIIGIVSFLVFLLILLLWRSNNFFFLHLRILLDPLRMPLWIERVLVCVPARVFIP